MPAAEAEVVEWGLSSGDDDFNSGINEWNVFTDGDSTGEESDPYLAVYGAPHVASTDLHQPPIKSLASVAAAKAAIRTRIQA